MINMSERKFGTKEWAEINKNIYVGCPHNCRYCFARNNALTRFKQIRNVEEWKQQRLREKDFNETPKIFKNKRIMFPTQHDINPDNIENCIIYLRKLLQVGNHILIVSKPHLDCVKRMCDEFKDYKKQIVFRFTIGSPNNNVLKFWDEEAPLYEERFESLKYAFDHGFQTSVSCEPTLDEDISLLVYELLPYITDTIWIGKMNFIKQRVDTKGWTSQDWKYMDKISVVIKDDFIKELYEEFKNNPKIKWKESIKEVLGLPEEDGVA